MYLWGGTGPSRWDCSGLTMGAWERAGVQLPHYSVAQYEQVRHIDEDELRPGDLIFWAVNPDDPGTIHHVAMYLGNGRMIHAPRTGKPVQIDSVYYWEPPDFFGRPMTVMKPLRSRALIASAMSWSDPADVPRCTR